MRIVGIGAGGHSRVIMDAIRAAGMDVGALTDVDRQLVNTCVDGTPVVGGDEIWPQLLREGFTHAFLGMGSIGDASRRRHLFEQLLKSGFEVIQVIHPAAVISPKAVLGRGAIVLAGAVVNCGAVLGDNVIVNTAAVVEHDCRVGDHVHIAPRACLAASVLVGAGAHVGAGATVRQDITIGPDAVVGAGAVVVRDVAANTTVVGVPARLIDRKHHSK